MEKINIAELLRNCPKGMELDCTMFDDNCVEFIDIVNNKFLPIRCRVKHSDGGYNVYNFTKYGCWVYDNKAKCVIFPKGKTTWEGFQRPFKDGDIVTYKYENRLVSMILSKFVNFVEIHHHCALYDNAKDFVTKNYIVGEPKYTRFATEEEKQKLFDAIKANGYKWNAETKTLEKLIKPKFKVGDRITSGKVDLGTIYNIIEVKESLYIVNKNNETDNYRIDFVNQDYYELVPNKFDINTLKPFESKVLIRNDENQRWVPAFWGYKDVDGFITTFGWCKYCIPYEGNEFLFKTNNDCDDYFKTWQE